MIASTKSTTPCGSNLLPAEGPRKKRRPAPVKIIRGWRASIYDIGHSYGI